MDYAKSVAWSAAGLGWSAMGLYDNVFGYFRPDNSLTFQIIMTVFWVVLIVVWVWLLKLKFRQGRRFDYDMKAAHRLEFLGYNRNYPFEKLNKSNG